MTQPDLLPEKFQKYIAANNLLKPSEKVLLAVSGGVDSMVMLNLFVHSDYRIAVAHCNFQLRGEESEEDGAMVEEQCRRLGVEYYCERFDTAEEVDRTGDSVQMVARRLRYRWFDKLCEEHACTTVAIAHHADDAIETFFINLLRGTGLKGLTGIHRVRGRVIRPILFASRREILDYAAAHKVPFREDSSNRSTKYLRNKIRLKLVPAMREINPGITDLMSENIRRLTATQCFVDRSMELIRTQVERREGELIIIDPEMIDPAMPIDFVLFELLNPYGFNGDVIDQLIDSLHHEATGKRFYAKERVACIERGKIIIDRIAPDDDCTVEIPEGCSKVHAGNSVLLFERTDIDSVESYDVPENVALLDADLLKFPLTARRWRDGDRFTPFGMTGHKKVSDFLTDAKVSSVQKERQFVVLSGERIVWLAGLRIDNDFRVSEETKNIIRIVRE